MPIDRLKPIGTKCTKCGYIFIEDKYKCPKCNSNSFQDLAKRHLKDTNDESVYNFGLPLNSSDSLVQASSDYLKEINYNLIQIGRRLEDADRKGKPLRILVWMLIFVFPASVLFGCAVLTGSI
jgi:hypothetical protein